MRSRLRACLSVLLIFALLGAVPARAAMAMPMVPQAGTMHQMHEQRGQVQQLQTAVRSPADHVPSHPDHHQQCHCGVHCGLCSVCHFSVPATMAVNFLAVFAMPANPRLAHPGDVWLPPDPRPPRA